MKKEKFRQRFYKKNGSIDQEMVLRMAVLEGAEFMGRVIEAGADITELEKITKQLHFYAIYKRCVEFYDTVKLPYGKGSESVLLEGIDAAFEVEGIDYLYARAFSTYLDTAVYSMTSAINAYRFYTK